MKHFFACSSIGINGVSTLIACELLSDVHSICTSRGNENENEIVALREYLVHNRGWKCLTILKLLGVQGISCGQELMTLLLALYPVTFQTTSDFVSPNPYVKFTSDNEIDSINFICHVMKQNTKMKHSSNSNASRRKRVRKYNVDSVKQSQLRKCLYDARDTRKKVNSESEEFSDGNSETNSLNVQLKSLEFGNLTTMFFGKADEKCKSNFPSDIELLQTSGKETYQDFVNEEVKAVFDSEISHFETSLLILQLLEDLREYEFPSETTAVVQIIEFSLDILWSLQFKTDMNLTNLEYVRLKAAASRLMLMFLQRILKSEVPVTAMIKSGFIPMNLRIIEDACGTSISDVTSEERLYYQEFIFATIYGTISILHDTLHQGKLMKNFKHFSEFFQLFAGIQNGKLMQRAIILLLDCNQITSVTRVGKIIDMIGVLISTLKKVRKELNYADKGNQMTENANTHHHYCDIFGFPFRNEPSLNSDSSKVCRFILRISIN